ncbi:MAG: glycine/sarcosine/betaine reductase selenoprotein B family protein, partial [Bacillota bacterium]|nr:glycine/sarcosine/betaine reductase selenoprotein B family protein [Bacillota bacterium]
MKKVLFYTNQFFGQIGGEEAAYTEPQVHEGPKGNANAFVPQLKDAKIVATILCGDNYYAENME